MNYAKQLEGRKILITGAASGMGKAITELFIEHGAAVAMCDLNGDALEAMACRQAIPIIVDVSSPEAVQAGVQKAAEAMGGIDGLVNAAGVLRVIPFSQTTLDVFHQVHNVNLLGPFMICQAALPHLQAAARATIINIASVAGLSAPQHMSAYASSKAGLIGLTKVLAAELGPNIRCNAIAPGIIRTPMTKYIWDEGLDAVQSRCAGLAMKRAGAPNEVARVALYLSSDQSSFVTGTVAAVDGGKSWH